MSSCMLRHVPSHYMDTHNMNIWFSLYTHMCTYWSHVCSCMFYIHTCLYLHVGVWHCTCSKILPCAHVNTYVYTYISWSYIHDSCWWCRPEGKPSNFDHQIETRPPFHTRLIPGDTIFSRMETTMVNRHIWQYININIYINILCNKPKTANQGRLNRQISLIEKLLDNWVNFMSLNSCRIYLAVFRMA